ncbi:MAG: acetylornithine transaminase [Deltaproteobacteria bacterium]|nr:acetylornithine transaminase [Deltaproteobacteria bacterium]NLV24178.1 acetylornithine transaminase [Deltaproteobacteria bacterium]
MTISQQWITSADQVLFNNYGRFPLVPVRGEGCRLWDAEGKSYLDFVAGVAVNSLGHCHPNVVRAIREQAGMMLHCSNLYYIPKQIELAQLLCANSFADRVFFCNSGAEANEAALKLARKYSRNKFGENRFEVISALCSFHGRTIGTISATGQDKVKTGYDPLLQGFRYVPYGASDALEKAVTATTCAVLLEPLQGEGGVNVPPPGYFKKVREICDRHNLLLILDEVQSGCGRTGKLFAYEHEGIEPDIMTLAKALAGGPPIGAMLAKEELASTFGPGSHGSTFGGNPLIAAAAVAALRTLLEEGILDNCLRMGRYLVERLHELQKRYPFIVDIRGRGLILGMELAVPGAGFVRKAMDKGVLINCTVDKVLRFVPPLVVNEAEIDEMIAVLDGIFAEEGK